eukprot:scaffold17390_cov104-Isochrysis_galbana.AAC.4
MAATLLLLPAYVLHCARLSLALASHLRHFSLTCDGGGGGCTRFSQPTDGHGRRDDGALFPVWRLAKTKKTCLPPDPVIGRRSIGS